YRVHLESWGDRKIQCEGSHANNHWYLIAQPARMHNRYGCGQSIAHDLQAYPGGVQCFSPGDETLYIFYCVQRGKGHAMFHGPNYARTGPEVHHKWQDLS